MAYALQYRLLHNQPIETMTLQEEKKQQQLIFIAQADNRLNTSFKSHLVTNYYVADTANHRVSIWLAPELDFFPVKVEIYDKDNRRGFSLSLDQRPKYN
jgi:hypothetical protein